MVNATQVKDRILGELKTFAGMAIYLFVVFGLFQLYQRIILAEYHIPYTLAGLAAINALVMGKVMLIAEDMHAGERRFQNHPLIYPIVWKSVLFAVIFILAHVIEEFIGDLIHKRPLTLPLIGGGTPHGVIIVTILISFCLLPFFAWREIDRELGPATLRKLLLKPKAQR